MAGPPIDPAPVFQLTDVGNAQRFVYEHGHDVRWVGKWESWLVWDGKRWSIDETLAVVRMAKATVHSLWEAVGRAGADERAALGKHWLHTATKYGIDAMLQLAKSEPGVAITVDDLDQNPWLLNVQNGTIDLRTGTLGPHERRHLITKLTDIPYDPTATCPAWEAFLLQIFSGDVALVDYVQRAIGYSLTGDMREECMFLLYGSGANGKSTLLEMIAHVTGEYGTTAEFDTFTETRQANSGGPSGDRARLLGSRFVRASEMREGQRMNEAVIKSMTSREKQVARHLRQSEFEFYYTHKLWLASNHKPVIRGTDHAIWRRMRLVPFHVTIRDEDKDADLLDRLKRELPGILRTSVDACLGWLEDGLRPPESVRLATAVYREESDVLGAFLADSCWTDDQEREYMVAIASKENGSNVTAIEEARIGAFSSQFEAIEANANDLFAVYSAWSVQRGERVMTQTAFGRRLADRGYVAEKVKRVTIRRGLKIRADVHVPTKTRAPYEGEQTDAF